LLLLVSAHNTICDLFHPGSRIRTRKRKFVLW
jgi:hypothetical protein